MSEEPESKEYDWSKRRRPDAVEWGMIAGIVVMGGCYVLARWLGVIN